MGQTVVHLTDDDRETVRRCLETVASGSIFEEPEFHSLFGLNRSEVGAICSSWPDVDENDPDVDLAVSNTLTNLIGYPHGKSLNALVGADESQLESILLRWRARS
jgi:hypothetical protein